MVKSFARVSLAPDDLLDAARTIPLGQIRTCNWLADWVLAATFLQWADRGLAEGDAYGLSNALTYAKRATASRIDLLVRYNHLQCFRLPFTAKIEALRELGLGIPDVVHELVIEPRNTLEHSYKVPTSDSARHAVGVAELFVRATDDECARSSIVGVAWNAQASETSGPEGYFAHFHGFSDGPMLFVDVFDERPAARIVDPGSLEIRSADLDMFSLRQSIELARILRKNYSSGWLAQRSPRAFFEEVKRRGGI